jgi:hypothetical protein
MKKQFSIRIIGEWCAKKQMLLVIDFSFLQITAAAAEIAKRKYKES